MRLNPWPRSLAGQMAMLIALALFVAQAINLGLMLRDRAAFRIEQSTGPAATRLADALEREAAGRPLTGERGRVRRAATNTIPAAFERRPDVAEELRDKLSDLGLSFGRIDAALRPLTPDRQERMRSRGRGPPPSSELVIAVEQPGRGWLLLRAQWPRGQGFIVDRLVFQTLILFGIILLPVLWITRRISQPLHALAEAARRFAPGDRGGALDERGPPDVRAVIAAFNALRLRVAAMLEEKDRMLGAIGHDLRTPLAALRVRIESVEDEDDRTRMAETIDEMNRTLDDILSLARMGRPSEPAVEVDLDALVDAVVEDFRDLGSPVSFTQGVRVTTRLRPTLMRRALRNLIENAVKYGTMADVRLDATPSAVAIVVTDRGPGIPTDRLDDVFDPFIRLETSRNRDTGGIGLGLALAQAIVREAGGQIALANRAEGGLAATITLPR